MRLIYHPAAEAELIQALHFYGSLDLELGHQFLAAIDQAIEVIRAAPDRWRIVEADVRRYLMPRFPFGIYYRILPDHLRVLAFKHHSRRPAYWHHRIS
jgi:toxin ParE1/3/4